MSNSGNHGKKDKLRAAIQERVNKEEHAFRLVEKMVLLHSVDEDFLLNACTYITVSQYKDVTEERAITRFCGYPLCANRITQVLKQKYRISVKAKKVYDISDRKNFCSNNCYKSSKYLESQLPAEPVWMREKTTSWKLKLLEEGESVTNKLAGSGEEVMLGGRRNGNVDEHVCSENKHVQNANKDEAYKIDDRYSERNENYQHEQFDIEHDDFDDQHEGIDDEYENAENKLENVHDNHDYDPIHKHIRYDHNDMGCIVERFRNVKIDLDFTDSDDDDVDDDDNEDSDVDHNDVVDGENNDNTHGFDNICDDDYHKNTEDRAQNSKSTKIKNSFSQNVEKVANKMDSNSESLVQMKNQVDNVNISCAKKRQNSRKHSGLQHTEQVKPKIKNRCTSHLTEKHCMSDKYDNTLRIGGDDWKKDEFKIFSSGGDLKDENRRKSNKKSDVDRVYKLLLEWCSAETRKYLTTNNESGASYDVKVSTEDKKESNRSDITLPSIDSKSQIAIRGNIVSEKLNKVMPSMLSKLSLTKADISSQLSYVLKTFRFTNTNIVLKPSEWTVVAMVLISVLVKSDASLKELLSFRQENFNLLLRNIIGDEDDVGRLLGVFTFVEEPTMVGGQQQFDMEELD